MDRDGVASGRELRWKSRALRVVGCAFISVRSRWKAVVNISPTFPWIDAASHCSARCAAPCRRKLKHVSAAALRDARGLPFSRQNTRREIGGIPGAQINRIQTYSRVSRSDPNAPRWVRSFQNELFPSHLRRERESNKPLRNTRVLGLALYICRMLSRLVDFFTRQHAKLRLFPCFASPFLSSRWRL